MVIDTSDNTIGICEGMVWVDMEAVADELDVDGEKRDAVIAWLTDNISSWNDHLIDAIVDSATSEIAEIARMECDAV